MRSVNIKSVRELKKLASHGGIEIFIQLNYNVVSKKFVAYDPATQIWIINNHIDGSCTNKLSHTNIKEAIVKNALRRKV